MTGIIHAGTYDIFLAYQFRDEYFRIGRKANLLQIKDKIILIMMLACAGQEIDVSDVYFALYILYIASYYTLLAYCFVICFRYAQILLFLGGA